MKAVVLAGGHATRLWPITLDRAKPLLPLGGRPIIDYLVDELEREVDEILVSTNEKFSQDFEEYIDDFDRGSIRVVVENQGCEEEKPGTIGAIINLIENEGLDDDLLIIGGDNYYSFRTSDFIDFCREKNSPANVVYDVGDFKMASNFGIVDVGEEDKITDFEEKPENPASTLASTACYFFPREYIKIFHEYENYFENETSIPADQYLDEPGRLIEWAHKQEDMYAYSFNGHWFDIGTRQGYLNAMKQVINGNYIEGRTENCKIGENVYIMENTEIKDTEIENSIIFPGTKIKDSTIEGSIIDENSDITGKDLKNAIIGKYTKI